MPGVVIRDASSEDSVALIGLRKSIFGETDYLLYAPDEYLMTPEEVSAQLEHIEAIEKRLWSAADTLRANSNYASNEYFLPVMGLVFLRHAYSRFLAVKDDIEAMSGHGCVKRRRVVAIGYQIPHLLAELVAALAVEHGHFMTCLEERVNKGLANEQGSPNDKDTHKLAV